MKLIAKFPLAIDSSIRADFKACQRKFYYQHILGVQRAGLNIHLHAGGCFATACEAVRVAFYLHKKDHDASLVAGLRALITSWGDYERTQDQVKNLAAMSEALVSYFDQYRPEFDLVQPVFDQKKPCIEFAFALPLDINHPETNDPLVFCGRYDELGQYQNQLYSIDEKTTSQFGATWPLQFELRGQFLGYSYAAQQYGYPVVGAIVRGTKITKNVIEHQEVLIPHSPVVIERWWESFQHDVKQMVECFKTDTYHYDFNEACNNYGGCPFKLVCQASDPLHWLTSSEYKIARWNPITRTEEV